MVSDSEPTPLRGVVDGIEHDLVLRPATVQCDECGDQYRAGVKYMLPEERGRLGVQLREAGWTVVGDHERHICPKCSGAGADGV